MYKTITPLETAGLLRTQTVRSYTALRKSLRLVVEDVREQVRDWCLEFKAAEILLSKADINQSEWLLNVITCCLFVRTPTTLLTCFLDMHRSVYDWHSFCPGPRDGADSRRWDRWALYVTVVGFVSAQLTERFHRCCIDELFFSSSQVLRLLPGPTVEEVQRLPPGLQKSK